MCCSALYYCFSFILNCSFYIRFYNLHQVQSTASSLSPTCPESKIVRLLLSGPLCSTVTAVTSPSAGSVSTIEAMVNCDIADGRVGTVMDVLYSSFIASSSTTVPLTSSSLLASPPVPSTSTATSGTSFISNSDSSQEHGNLNLFQDFNGEDMEKKKEGSNNRGRDATSNSSSINRSRSEGSSGIKVLSCHEKGDLFVVIEQMLQTGRREEAALLASKNKEWALALLIASNCGTDTYKEISRAFASSTFPSSSPLHLATLLFSSQVKNIINM